MVKIILVEIVLLLIKLAMAIGLLALVVFAGYCLVHLYLMMGAVTFLISLAMVIGLLAFCALMGYLIGNL